MRFYNLMFAIIMFGFFLNTQAQERTKYYLTITDGEYDVFTIPGGNWSQAIAWNTNTINIKLYNINMPPNVDFDTWYFDSVDEALTDWDYALSTSNLNFNLVLPDDQNPPANNAALFFGDESIFPSTMSNVGGQARMAVTSQREIVYSDGNTISPSAITRVYLNNSSYYRSAGNKWTVTDLPDYDELHVASVVRHEIGHLLGLGHNYSYSASIMHNTYHFGEIYTIDTDIDYEAVSELYFYWSPGPVGIDDEIIITAGPNFMEKDNQVSYRADFYSSGASIITNTWKWRVYLLYDTGEYEYTNSDIDGSVSKQNMYSTWSVTLDNSLPSYNWEYDNNGYILGKIHVAGKDTDNYWHSDYKTIGFDVPPQVPTNFSDSWDNNHPKISWDANEELDVIKYEVYKKDGFNASWQFLTNVTDGTSYVDQSELKYTGPPNQKDYVYYKVRAVDEADQQSSFTSSLGFAINLPQQIGNLVGENIYQIDTNIPTEFRVEQNYPNPFNPETYIRFGLPEATHTKLNIYNSAGQKVRELVNNQLEAGYYSIRFNAADLPSGIYFAMIQTKDNRAIKRMLLIK